MRDYADVLAGKQYSPREYVEHQLNMSEEEKQEREHFFEELFRRHNEQRADKSGNDV